MYQVVTKALKQYNSLESIKLVLFCLAVVDTVLTMFSPLGCEKRN